jgi:hypothetical protein
VGELVEREEEEKEGGGVNMIKVHYIWMKIASWNSLKIVKKEEEEGDSKV